MKKGFKATIPGNFQKTEHIPVQCGEILAYFWNVFSYCIAIFTKQLANNNSNILHLYYGKN